MKERADRRTWLVGLGGVLLSPALLIRPATAAQTTQVAQVTSKGPSARPQGLDAVSEGDAALAVRQAWERGGGNALTQLGTSGGFAGNERLRLGLPDSLRQGERLLRLAGRGAELDGLVDAMNRAAEQSMPIMRPQVLRAVRGLKIVEPKVLLTGGEDALSEHLREHAGSTLAERWRPVIDTQLKNLGALTHYQSLAQKAGVIGLDRGEGGSIQDYVTQRTLAGFFAVTAEQERLIRLDPARFGSRTLTRVFGAMR